MNHTTDIRQFSFEKLDVWQVMLDAIELAHAVANAVPSRYGDLADQIRRASQSMAANFGEGLGKSGKDRLRYHGYALGSAYETAAHIEVAGRLRLVPAGEYGKLRTLLLRAVSMLTRMTR